MSAKALRSICSCALLILPACAVRDVPEYPFEEAAARTGLQFQHFGGASQQRFMPEIMGSGAALLDFDNDGDLDVYLVQGDFLNRSGKSPEPLIAPPDGWRPGNRLFRNDLIPSGQLKFVDVTEASGTGYAGVGMGVAASDIDNDGDIDLYVTNYGSNVFYRNEGGGRFTDISALAGADDPLWSTSATFLDYDRDGLLDLFVVNYVDFTVAGNRDCGGLHGGAEYCGPQVYDGLPSRLFRNLGQGRFRDVTVAAGLHRSPGPGLGVVSEDFNGDSWPDAYVANDGRANHLWINRKDGTFREAALELGAAYAETGKARAGMGVDAADADGDGQPDVIVTNLTNEGSTMFSLAGAKGFFDASSRFGLPSPTGPFTGFGVGWFDFDNDGRLDLFIANGAVKVEAGQHASPYPYNQRNLLLRNTGAALEDITAAAGPALALSEISRAAVFGDIDNDGDVDVLVTNNSGPVRLLLNRAGNGKHWLLVRLDEVSHNRFGTGAMVGLLRPGKPALWRKCQPGYSYLSSNDPRVHFGLGDQGGPVELIVRWPDGTRERYSTLRVDRIVTLRRGQGQRVE